MTNLPHCACTRDRSSRSERTSRLLSYLTRARNLSGIRTTAHVMDDPFQIVGERAQLPGLPARERLHHDLVGRRAVGGVRLLALGAEVDDGRSSVGGVGRAPHVAALAEPRDLPAHEGRLEVGEVRQAGQPHRPRRVQHRDEVDGRPGEVHAGALGPVARGFAPGTDARDAHDRLLDALQVVQPGHGGRTYRLSDLHADGSRRRRYPFGVTTARLFRSLLRKRSYAIGASSNANSSTSTRRSPVSASAITSCRSAIDAAIGMNRSHSSGSTPHDTLAVPPPAPTIAMVPRFAAQLSAMAMVVSSPTKSNTAVAPVPPVSSRTWSAVVPSDDSAWCAPSSTARSRRCCTRSTAITRAPVRRRRNCTAYEPRPPAPMTTAVDPGTSFGRARLTAW